MAKAPIPGTAKTRLAPRYGDRGAAELATAALLDTLRAARRVPGATVVVALTGDLDAAVGADEIRAELQQCTTFRQRGDGFAQRLVHAHIATAALGMDRVVQIGMDTPQVGAARLTDALDRLDPTDSRCVLGAATDGGWWAFGTVFARGARSLGGVSMSRPDTGNRTRDALCARGLTIDPLDSLTDVDLPADVDAVARDCAPESEFTRVARLLGTRATARPTLHQQVVTR